MESRSRVFVERKPKKYNFKCSKCVGDERVKEGRPSKWWVGLQNVRWDVLYNGLIYGELESIAKGVKFHGSYT